MSCIYTSPSGSQVDFTLQEYTPPSGSELVFELCPITAPTIKAWTGTVFEDKPIYYWDGSAWVAPTALKRYDGTNFNNI